MAATRLRTVSAGAVHLWRFDLNGADRRHVASGLMQLDAQERLRADRFARQSDRENFILGRAAIRRALADYRGVAIVDFVLGRYGKPALVGADAPHCSWSHSGPYWLLAVAADGPVGVDIEHADRDIDCSGTAAIAFHPDERRCLSHSQQVDFYRVWTRKEALLKGLGLGLHDDMASVSIADPDGRLSNVVSRDDHRWHLADLPAPDGYAAALATRFDHTHLVRVAGDADGNIPHDISRRRPWA